jgi:hypothetical protein
MVKGMLGVRERIRVVVRAGVKARARVRFKFTFEMAPAAGKVNALERPAVRNYQFQLGEVAFVCHNLLYCLL